MLIVTELNLFHLFIKFLIIECLLGLVNIYLNINIYLFCAFGECQIGTGYIIITGFGTGSGSGQDERTVGGVPSSGIWILDGIKVNCSPLPESVLCT